MNRSLLLFISSLILGVFSQNPSKMTVLPLGVNGGFYSDSLSCYAVRSSLDPCKFVLLDAGTILTGLNVANEKGFLAELHCTETDPFPIRPLQFLQNQVYAYFLSHSHLDHIGGFVINSVEDSSNQKSVIGLPSTIENLKNHMLNNKIWVNFGPDGLKKYSYLIAESQNWIKIPNTIFQFKAFPLYHVYPFLSTAFLLSDGEQQILYFGDVGPDEVENKNIKEGSADRKDNNKYIWGQVAPLIVAGTLHSIFLECSFVDGKPEDQLFGHLTPKWLTQELTVLEQQVESLSPNKTIAGLNVVITHIKPIPNVDIQGHIKSQLLAQNTFKVNYIFAAQATPFVLGPHSVEYPSVPVQFWFEQNKIILSIIGGVIFLLLCVVGVVVCLFRSRRPSHEYAEIEVSSDLHMGPTHSRS